VVNKAFLDKFHKSVVGYAKVYDKYTSNYLTIHDVCDVCNNGILSLLDNYFLDFYSKNIPNIQIVKDSFIQIEYDFDKLSRWLLKTLYNSERKHTYSNIPKKLHRFKQYILGKDKRIKLFKIYLELILDVPPEEIEKFVDEETRSQLPNKLSFLRMGTAVLSSQMRTEIKDVVKHFTSSNFVFHVFVIDPGKHTEKLFQKRLKQYVEASGIVLNYLEPRRNSIIVKPSTRTIVDILEKTIEGEVPYIINAIKNIPR
jgi:hypothetical protein